MNAANPENMDDTEWSAEGLGDGPTSGDGLAGDEADTASGWELVAAHDGVAAVIDVALDMDPERTITRSELCEAADVPYKTLYLADTVDALVAGGLLEKTERDGAESTFGVDPDSPVFEAAAAFDAAVGRQSRPESV